MKTCICALAKCENNYLKEWVEHHLSLGFDTIYIYDNNDLDGERVRDVVSCYPEVIVIEKYLGVKECGFQSRVYTEFWHEHRKECDWVVFIDIDEFIMLEGYDTIQGFLSQDKFSNADIVRLRWKVFDDGNMLDVVDGDYSVVDRLKTFRKTASENCAAKSILRTGIDIGENPITPFGYHTDQHLLVVDGEGRICDNSGAKITKEVKTPYGGIWLNHYMTKTIGEYVRQKVARGDVNASETRYGMGLFWALNDFSMEKLQYAAEQMKVIRNNGRR